MIGSGETGAKLADSSWEGLEMITELDVWRSAAVLVREHGDGAAMEAAFRADERMECGDLDGCALWKRVMAAVDELCRGELKEGERPN